MALYNSHVAYAEGTWICVPVVRWAVNAGRQR
jgi:hypothetical protein